MQFPSGGPCVVAVSRAMCGVLDLVRRIAASQATTVLLEGESGVGKDLVAKEFHRLSDRKCQPFIALNCAAIPETLLESELFGHEQGAFTGAQCCKPGLLELADRGTLFLDEISQLSHALQAKLLRVLEEQRIRRLGAVEDKELDVRFVAATNQDLRCAVRQGSFRLDLFYRLNLFHLRIPPLRERVEDILPLADHFVDVYSRRYKRVIGGIAREARDAMLTYQWPGNVRELRNAVERAMVIEESTQIEWASLPPDICLTCRAPQNESGEELSLGKSERRLLIRALEKSGGDQTAAARLLGISRDALRHRMKKHELMASRIARGKTNQVSVAV